MIPNQTRFKVAIVAPTCFYYQVPLFRQLAANPRLELTVYFCTEEALKAQDLLHMYRTGGVWGDEHELLSGYAHKFLPNYSPQPSYLKWPFGLMNFGVWAEVRKNRPNAVILMSWMNVTWWVLIAACLTYKVPFLYMTDANAHGHERVPRWKKWIKHAFLGKFVFRRAAGFLCAGTANLEYYAYHGVPENKLVPFAYSGGYETMLQASVELTPSKSRLRTEQGIAESTIVILYCGRLSKEKALFDLLDAFRTVQSQHPEVILALVGDGGLRKELEARVAELNLQSVRFLGFQNRKEIAKYYVTADALVLPSFRETWGIVVNEALCFGLPVIVSDQVGAGDDLVLHEYNGFRFPSGDVEALGRCIKTLVELPKEERLAMGHRSLDLSNAWIKRDLPGTLVQYLETLDSRKAEARGHGQA